MIHRLLLGAALAAALAAPALAETVKFHAVLAGSSEVPPVKSAGSGTADATLDTATHALTYDVTFSGFASPVTMAHFHGPAPAGKNAGVAVPLGMSPTSPIHGTATLTPDQQQQLLAGLWYANVHTASHPKGAARGQMEKVQ
jgi:hypothetical protein